MYCQACKRDFGQTSIMKTHANKCKSHKKKLAEWRNKQNNNNTTEPVFDYKSSREKAVAKIVKDLPVTVVAGLPATVKAIAISNNQDCNSQSRSGAIPSHHDSKPSFSLLSSHHTSLKSLPFSSLLAQEQKEVTFSTVNTANQRNSNASGRAGEEKEIIENGYILSVVLRHDQNNSNGNENETEEATQANTAMATQQQSIACRKEESGKEENESGKPKRNGRKIGKRSASNQPIHQQPKRIKESMLEDETSNLEKEEDATIIVLDGEEGNDESSSSGNGGNGAPNSEKEEHAIIVLDGEGENDESSSSGNGENGTLSIDTAVTYGVIPGLMDKLKDKPEIIYSLLNVYYGDNPHMMNRLKSNLQLMILFCKQLPMNIINAYDNPQMMYSFLEVYHGDNRDMMNGLKNNTEKMNQVYELMFGQGIVLPEDYETMGQLDNTNPKKINHVG